MLEANILIVFDTRAWALK